MFSNVNTTMLAQLLVVATAFFILKWISERKERDRLKNRRTFFKSKTKERNRTKNIQTDIQTDKWTEGDEERRGCVLVIRANWFFFRQIESKLKKTKMTFHNFSSHIMQEKTKNRKTEKRSERKIDELEKPLHYARTKPHFEGWCKSIRFQKKRKYGWNWLTLHF